MAASSGLFLAIIYNQSQLAERKHVARNWSINTAATVVPLSLHPSAITNLAAAIFGRPLFGEGALPVQYYPCGSVSQPVLLSLVTSPILTRLDYTAEQPFLVFLATCCFGSSPFSMQRTPCLSPSEVWPRHTSSPGPALVAGFWENTRPTSHACLSLSSQYGAP